MEKDLTNTNLGMHRTLWADTYLGMTGPVLDFLADPIREYMPEAAR